MKIRNYIERLFVVVLLALVGLLSYADSFSVTYTPPRSNTSIYDVTNYSYYQKDNYFIMPGNSSTTFLSESYFTIFNIFADKSITSDVKVTLNVAAHSEGSTNPSSSTFSWFGDTEHTVAVNAVTSDTPPTSTTATNMCYTVSKEEAIAKFSKDLVIKIYRKNKNYKQVRLYSVTVEFEYESTQRKRNTSLSFGEEIDDITTSKTFAFDMAPISTPATLTDGPEDAVITYGSSDESVATVSDMGVVTIHKPGTATISASFAENDDYFGSSCAYTLEEAKMQSELSFADATMRKQVGDADFSYPPTMNVENAQLSYKSSNTNVATVDADGLIHLVGSGFADITATCAENDYWLGSSASFTLIVTNPNAGGDEYVLVTSSSQLAYGDKLLITNAYHTNVMSKQDGSLWCSIAESEGCGFSFSSDKTIILVTNPENVAVITLEEGTVAGTYAFHVPAGYLYAASSNASSLKTQTDKDKNSNATITCNNSVASNIQFQGIYKYNVLRYNKTVGVEKFGCYSPNNSNQLISIYKLLQPQVAEEELSLKQLIEKGAADDHTIYTINNELCGVAALPSNVLLAKDANGEAVEINYPESGWNSYFINAVSLFSDADDAEHANTKSQNFYDQSNWVEIHLPASIDASNYVDKIIAAGSVKGYFTDANNPVIELAPDATLTISGEAEPYERNAMCPANFMDISQPCVNHPNHGTYYFSTPKPNELVQVVWAVYNDGAFYIPMTDGGVNVHGFKGGFDIDLAYNITQENNFTDGNMYQFKAIVKKAPASVQSGKRKVLSDTREKSTTYVVYPLNLDKNIITSASELAIPKIPISHHYFNCMGAELIAPTTGICIEVTTYTDGSTTSQKIIQ